MYIAGIKVGGDDEKKTPKKNLVAKSAEVEKAPSAETKSDSMESKSDTDYSAMGKQGAKAAASGASGANVASSAMMASGNPYLIAAGAGLGVLSASQARNRANAEAKVEMEMTRRARIADAMSKLGSGVGSIG